MSFKTPNIPLEKLKKKNRLKVGVKPSAEVLKQYCAQRSRGLLYWRFFVTAVHKYRNKIGLNSVFFEINPEPRH